MNRVEDLEVDDGYPWMEVLKKIVSREPVFSDFLEVRIYDKSSRYTRDGIQFRDSLSPNEQKEIKDYCRCKRKPPRVET
jgi:hypothetical protein